VTYLAVSIIQSSFQETMLSSDKILVVLGVVLIIWIGILFFLFRTDAKIKALEREMKDSIFDQE